LRLINILCDNSEDWFKVKIYNLISKWNEK
jgi:hypothetical protein